MPYKSKRFTRTTRQRLEIKYSTTPTPFWEWLSSQLLDHALTEHALAHQLKIDAHNVQAWRKGSLPNPATCYLLAGYFHVRLSVVYVLANIPLKAAHEINIVDRFGVGSLTDTPQSHLLAMIHAQGYPESFTTSVMVAIARIKEDVE